MEYSTKSIDSSIVNDLLSEGSWQKRFLGIKDGHLYFNSGLDRVAGLYYTPNSGSNLSTETGTALPSVCPNCAADYSRRRNRKSPLRGFRTGFGKTNQVLAKELFKAIPESKEKPRKLVAFSDSREESARFANDIEKENYNEIIKELLVKERANIIIAYQLVSKFEAGAETEAIELKKKLDPKTGTSIYQSLILNKADAATNEQKDLFLMFAINH